MYIKAAKLFFNVLREKLSPRPLAAESDNLEEVKDFAAKVYTTFFVQPKICNYIHIIKRTSKSYFTVNKYVLSRPSKSERFFLIV
jgi:hypothetical protein